MDTEKAMRAEISQEVVDLLYLCGRALAGEAADLARVRQMNLPCVYALSVNQSLSALAYHGLEPVIAEIDPQDALFATWRSERDRVIRRQMLFAAERAQIFAWFVENGVWHAPLKGVVLEDRYPRVGMREYSDNDILYDPARQADVARFFKERGYRRNADGHVAAINDSYTKEPVYRFEMHRRLFSGYASPTVVRYYDGLRSRLISADGSPFSLRLTDEDNYLYLIAHAHKHFQSGGTGVRILCDLHTFVPEGADFDWDYVGHELQVLEMADFGESLMRLAACVFSSNFNPVDLNDEDAETLFALTTYGTYGTIDHQAELKVKRGQEQDGSMGGYVRKRILPDADWWEVNHPFAYRHIWARPPLLVFRAARAVVSPLRRQHISAEIKAILRKAKSNSQ